MLRRKMVSLESTWLPTNYNIAVGLRCKDKKSVDLVLEKLVKSFAALHTHIEGDEYVFQSRDVPVYRIPSNVTSLIDQAFYMENNFKKNPSHVAGSIAVSDDSVVFSASHGIYDGGTIKNFLECLSFGKELPELKLPTSSFEPIMKEIQSVKCIIPDYFTDKDALRFKSTDSAFKNSAGNSTVAIETIYDNEFQIYDKKGKTLHGLTEAALSSLVLAVSAMNEKFDKTGLWEVIGMRNFASKEYDLRQGQYFANIPVSVNISSNAPIREMMKLFRIDMKKKLANKATYQFLRGNIYGFPKAPVINGAPIVFSSAGNFMVKGPLTDCFFMPTSYADVPFEHLSCLMYSVDDGQKKKFLLTSNYSTKLLSTREASAFVGLTAYSLKNIDLNTKIGEAIDMLIEEKKKIYNRTNTIDRIIRF
ncbi:hypothetical protein TVAG_153900 [Trichomonas vaginalis G3]|uniref:Condensation domain-containing protein n=1 Tax=Trichomonas vaginalis (strain ATCC PRA-98 / G3) TaxID=412133 RepID=A2EPU5_TRIV3|nr:hypothetical protein TVAGG3_0352120 [Trichomonas vaginalis G3]EAY05356.1 hypothetical protein TVAG_153900 [Trichomonas vaginalis G3]KAI5531359.1 hypothetical protein TVAGG3_0352120 [Trichomonas vaginalis G3]|eukprot:XP_001317579.1 hypothetical protein [Trichomonas vaginalis G3]